MKIAAAESIERLRTPGEIAREHDLPMHVVNYAIQRYRIRETQRAGIVRLFDAAGVQRIMSAVRRIGEGAR